MMRNFIFYGAMIGLVLLSSCGSKKSEKEELLFETQNPNQIVSQEDPTSAKIPLGDTSKTSLDWDGTYVGTVPCADCSGIKTKLTLTNESTYTLEEEFLNENKKNVVDGTFTWDDKGSEVILDDKGKSQRFKVGENKLIKLDKEEKPIGGKRTNDYTLLKE